jgi:Fur family ferric uptake transcriptional regulator
MVRLGLLQELELAEGRKYYELNTPLMDQHHHLVCVLCGEVEEFEDATMGQVGHSESVTRGFSLLNCQFTVYGICPRCQSLL